MSVRVGFIFSLFLTSVAWANTPTLKSDGGLIRWPGAPHLQLAGNPTNRSGLSDVDVRASVVRGLQRWQEASENHVGFDYWQGTQFDRNSDYNGISNLYFASAATGATGLSPGILGLTQVWYNTSSGEMLETDIVLNDNDFYFTTNPADSSGTGAGWPSGRVFLDNVVTHELGHALGLSHASSLQSTMLYVESPDQAHLSCDDQTAIRALYDPRSADTGRITGQITDSSGSALFGASVVAISERRGVAVETALTRKDGTYSLDSLEPGQYRVMIEPFTADGTVLSAYFSSINARVCGGQFFPRQFVASSVSVFAGSAVSQNFGVQCGAGMGAMVSQSAGSNAMNSSAPVLFSGASGSFSKVDQSGSGHRSYYQLKGISGAFEIHALSYSLYSPVAPTLKLLNASGGVVLQPDPQSYYQSESGYENYDSVLSAANLPLGDYFLEVDTSSLSSYQYPIYGNDLDSVSFFVLTGSFDQPTEALASLMPHHPKCRTNESFSDYQSPGGGPARRSTASAPPAEQKSSFLGFCGTTQRGGPGGGAPFSMILSWFLPWIFMGFAVKLLRPRGVSATLST